MPFRSQRPVSSLACFFLNVALVIHKRALGDLEGERRYILNHSNMKMQLWKMLVVSTMNGPTATNPELVDKKSKTHFRTYCTSLGLTCSIYAICMYAISGEYPIVKIMVYNY